MSVVRVQASVLDVGSDVTILHYSFFEILRLILHSTSIAITCIYSTYFIFWVAFLFPIVSIIWWTCYHNSPILIPKKSFQDFKISIVTTDNQINLGTLIECFHRLLVFKLMCSFDSCCFPPYLIERHVWNETRVSFSKHYDILSIVKWIVCNLEIIENWPM